MPDEATLRAAPPGPADLAVAPDCAALRFTPEERARHAALSPVQLAWLDFVASRVEALSPGAFVDLAAEVELEPEITQPWPLFLDAASQEPILRAGIETLRLVKTVPERILGGDAERLSEFYGLGEPFIRAALRQVADPACLGDLIGRGDFILGPRGFACCEFNVAGNLGGWQMGLWKERMRVQPLVAEFLAGRRLRVLPSDTLEVLLEHAVAVGLARGLAAEGELNLAALTYEVVTPWMRELVDRRYREVLARLAPGVSGRLIVCVEGELSWRGDRACFGATPVHLFVDQVVERIDGPVFRAQDAGRGFSFNGLLTPILADKRNLALLSEQADEGDLYDAGERAAIARWIPWTRLLVEDFTGRGGERVYLPDFARAERERLVIKPPAEYGGKDVYAGYALSPAEWDARLDAALAEGRWVVQEYIPSEAYLFQAPAGGAVLHDLVWGAFVFGDRYGSCLLRGAPSGSGIVNVSRGARRIVVLEVEESCDAE